MPCPPYLHLAYLPAPGVVRLRLSAYEVEGESVSHEIDRQFAALQRIIPRYVLGFERATMQEIVHNLLTQRRQTLATAESCTGGSIAARFTAMPGASAYFLCGVVAYSNESKNNLLGVDPETIASRGAVSEEVARQMAEGARRITGADYAVATTGIAGPAGGTEQKPVGTVWMAVAGPHRTVTLLKQCGTDRGTGYRPGERLRTRAPARRNRTGCRRRITRFRHFPKPPDFRSLERFRKSSYPRLWNKPRSSRNASNPFRYAVRPDAPENRETKSPIRSLAPSDEIQRRIIEHTPSKRVNSPTVITGTSYRYISNIRLPKPKFEAIPEQILPPGQRQNHPVIPTAPLSARFSETRERP